MIGRYLEVKLKTCKSAQTGVLHTWRLWANDDDPRLCPVCVFLRVMMVYGTTVPTRGPFFLRVSKLDSIQPDQPVVSPVATLLGLLPTTTHTFCLDH